MSSLIEMREEMKQILNSESWHNGNGVTARAMDKLRDEINKKEKNLRLACKCPSDGGDCEACQELYA